MTRYTCHELQYMIDQIDKEIAEIRIHRKTLLYQKRCFKMEIELILRRQKP